MAGTYTREQRRTLAAALRRNEPLRCPACGAGAVPREVEPERRLAYVRRRVLIVCPACRRAAVLDLR